MNDLPGMVKKIASAHNHNIEVEAITVGGSNLKGHASRPETFQKINSGKWDAVVFQGHSREMSYDTTLITSNTIPYILQMIDSVKMKSPCANFYLFMTWGYKEGHRDSLPDDSYQLMQKRVERGYRYVQRNIPFLNILPVGLVWNEIISNNYSIELYDPDKSHPSKSGTFAAASTIENKLLNTTNPLSYYPVEIGDSVALLINETSLQYFSEDSSMQLKKEFPTEITVHMKGKKVELDFVLPERMHYEIDYKNKSKWTQKMNHRYCRKGLKTIVVRISDSCEQYRKEVELQLN